ncbi:hypothetical protein [Flavobacterium sp. NRK1]|uniref:hypothetical protein n=1 Tax=Flavobacterium sp. NRK1 TaxID=2954929 RepID=UPI0020937C6E|nr:hypothetical protein [Flavobacterium sp. NRK1]MCO6147918.1 hypothetical protein [Flavobacterium sp. NRK1]
MVVAAIFVCLGAIIYQDLKYRHLHVLWPIILFAAGTYIVMTGSNKDNGITLIAINSAFLLFTFFVLIAYMSLKNKAFINPFKNYFGLGDLLFYLAITPFFLLTNYILFFISSMVFSIIVFFIFKKIINKENIPLAGYASILLVLFLGKDLLFNYPVYNITQII